jgi:transposase
MKVSHIIGADLSKKSIDFASHQLKTHLKVENNCSGFQELIKWLKNQQIDVSNVMVVMEHTGLYSYHLEQFLHQNAVSFTKVSGLAIKRSMGLVRGKTDKQDAKRIAQYGCEKADRLIPASPIDKNLQRLEMLHSTRERLVKNRAGLKTAVQEYQEVCGLKKSDIIIKPQLQLIKNFDRQIQKLDDAIEAIVNKDTSVNDNFHLLKSIKGVGKVLALATIIKTQNFTRFANARKFACFCGTAPFKNTSGTSIRGRTRISHLADKRMKTLLDLAAKSAIQYDKELHQYYVRRTANGKSKMSTINVVRNKILYRMFAVVNRQTAYETSRPTNNKIINPTLKN